MPEPPEPEPRQPEWAEPDATQMPVSLGIDLTLAVSETAAIYVSRPAAYTSGLAFDLVMVQRSAERDDPQMLWRYGFHGAPPRESELAPEFLRFGVELDGGMRLTNLGFYPPRHRGPDDRPTAVLLPGSSGGHAGLYRQHWWLWPLPQSGDLRLVCEWPAFEIPESHATLSGDAIRQAAARAKAIWPAWSQRAG